MHATLIGNNWNRRRSLSQPVDIYCYYRGGVLELEDFVARNAGNFIVGMLSYDLGYELHGIIETTSKTTHLPDAFFMAFSNGNEPPVITTSAVDPASFIKHTSQTEYHAAFEALQRHIYNGDIYQANLTQQLEAQYNGNGRQLFDTIYAQNPGSMSAYIEGPGFEILSFSPEKFISVKDGIIETMPIKGTAPRGQETALLTSEKEQAELNMITDLLRNDIGKVSKAGSVRVLAHRKIMKLPNISHTYSHIKGELRSDISPIQALLSMFPGGSITGCPKRRAMEIIDEIEWVNRGPYCGCLVSIDETGNLDSSILIRTIIKQETKLLLSVGGGIVVDSKETSEHQETLSKAAAIIQALA